MPNTPFHHLYRIDPPALQRTNTAVGSASLVTFAHLPNTARFVNVDPIVFTHAYLLLGEQPQRFATDLSLYLSAVRTFFERTDSTGGLSIPPAANADSRRRLSEDLGVALAAYFMVQVFGITWDSISQIPQNSKLSKKRPNFQGFASNNERFLFEAKGTTKMAKVESALSKAITQVYGYPEQAQVKLAILSYLSADDRFFPSTTFVVDPPALPDEINPDAETSRLLHFEKILQFAGLPHTAKRYISTLSQDLREKHRVAQGGAASARRAARLDQHKTELHDEFRHESQPEAKQAVRFEDKEFIGQTSNDPSSGFKVFLGAERRALDSGIRFGVQEDNSKHRVTATDEEVTSVFPDATLLRINRRNPSSQHTPR